MNLYLFPAVPSNKGGYNIAVTKDYEKLRPSAKDIIIWNDNIVLNTNEPNNSYYFNPVRLLSKKAIENIIKGRFSQEFSASELQFLSSYNFEEIHCDEVIFYRAIRKLFPNKKITVRFHNLFYRILVREKLLKIKSDWRFEGKMQIVTKLEKEIFLDNNVYKIFITEEDGLFYKAITGRSDYEIWDFEPNVLEIEKNRNAIQIKHILVWFGGIESHKTSSVKWFVNEIFPQIKAAYPDTELHLFGSKTESFDNQSINVYGHGHYDGNDMPFKDTSLYINPDILGGGIKIKLLSYFNRGVPFITTPFGYEGYNKNLIDGKYCNVVNNSDWVDYIINYFRIYS